MPGSTADHTTVILPDHHSGGTGRHANRIAVRPGATHIALTRAPFFRGGGGARVLHVDEHGFLIRGGDHAGDFLTDGTSQEAAHLTGLGIGTEHGIVAEHLEYAAVLAAFTDIGLNPDAAVLVDPQTIRRAEQVVSGQRLTVGPFTLEVIHATLTGVSAEQEDIPGERG